MGWIDSCGVDRSLQELALSDDRGSATVWMLGLAILLLLFGGLSLDFWRALALQRELAAVADSAAIAGASGIDEGHYRGTGEVIISPKRSRDRVLDSVTAQHVVVDDVSMDVSADGSILTVEVAGTLELGLLRVFVDQGEPLLIRASATAVPRLVP